MVVGESGTGKTTCACAASAQTLTPVINTLFRTELAQPRDEADRHTKQLSKTVDIDIVKAELEEKGFKVNLTVIDTPGFGDYVNNRDSWVPLVEFLDDQHEQYLRQEQQP